MQHNDRAHSPSGSAPELTAEEKRGLLRVARQALQAFLETGALPTCHTDAPALLQHRATFVTLRRRTSEELRGCRGESLAQRPLIESVAHNAIASATNDPRFPPVTIDEVPDLHIEINALTPMTPIKPEDVVVGRHGLMIVQGNRSGLLLPDVPVQHGWNRATFLRGLCRKAGLPHNAWTAEDAQLFGFEADAWSEKEERGSKQER